MARSSNFIWNHLVRPISFGNFVFVAFSNYMNFTANRKECESKNFFVRSAYKHPTLPCTYLIPWSKKREDCAKWIANIKIQNKGMSKRQCYIPKMSQFCQFDVPTRLNQLALLIYKIETALEYGIVDLKPPNAKIIILIWICVSFFRVPWTWLQHNYAW